MSIYNKLLRFLWNIVWVVFFRTSPRPFHFWRRVLLRIFGAEIGKNVHVYPKCIVWAPWNLIMEDDSCMADHVNCYNVAKVIIKKKSIVSQYSFLCTATHDYSKIKFPLISKSIVIGESVWIAADVFIAPGVQIGDGSVVLARSSVFKDVNSWIVTAGNPLKELKNRELS